MANSSGKTTEPKHTEAGPDIAPHGREKTMEEHRGRLEGEPAAAPMETDAESGGASAVSGLPEGDAPRDPAEPYLEGAAEFGTDAPKDGGTGWLKWVIAALIGVAVIYAVMQF
ncbi:hypothetical protein ACEWPM_018660 [Roseovarius sp. S4756]|uniref:hypothetical protein n=1 Tax=Roseovarius maritimus TaxID=3342637 RepID=UPI003727AD7D